MAKGRTFYVFKAKLPTVYIVGYLRCTFGNIKGYHNKNPNILPNACLVGRMPKNHQRLVMLAEQKTYPQLVDHLLNLPSEDKRPAGAPLIAHPSTAS